jgi:hypothetical protein
MGSRRASSATAGHGCWRSPRIALAATLPVLVLLHGCVGFYVFQGAMLAAEVGGAAADAAARESTLHDALTSRTFAYPLPVVTTALQQAAQLDGRRIERDYRPGEGQIVWYAASPSTGGAAGSVVLKSYSRGQFTFSTTVIVLRGPTGSEEVGRKVGEQLLDAMAADLAGIERQVATKTVAVDVAAVFDALGQVGQSQGRKVLVRDATSRSLRVSFPFFIEGRNAEGFMDITCVAESGGTTVTLVGDGKSQVVEVRKAANALLYALTELLHQPE